MTRLLVLVALLAIAGCGGGSAVSNLGTVVSGAKGSTVQVQVGKGQRFSLAVQDNPSVGDSWELVALPDAKVAAFISKERRAESDAPGSGGTAYFVFNAKRPGVTQVRLFNCWRCGASRTPADETSRQNSGEAIFEITVTD
ncbi:protease inhibitor I42 family protein [Thermoactinospora rubra]|uniref:protease inhibitor I42 family protein n=1 Tax=Thermoactinospora rubra TaxID=1088767 RepID=UPI000A103FDB|nr:protease inhibitor I42 family protein [Thermoactinospora rubra]